MAKNNGLSVFLSYSHKDEQYLDELRPHLANLVEEGLADVWHDRAIAPGEEWEQTILEALEQADVIVLLISSDFNASKFCRQVEMKGAVERHHEGTATVIPVVIRHIERLPEEIAHIQSLPKDLKPLTSFKPRDKGYVAIVHGIRSVLKKRQSFDSNHKKSDLTKMSQQTDDQQPTIGVDVPAGGLLTVFLRFIPKANHYEAEVHVGFESQPAFVLSNVRLWPSDTILLGDGTSTNLGDITQRAANAHHENASWLTEHGLLEIGRKLFDETVGRINGVADRDQLDLRLVSDDEHLMKLPWPLINRRGVFLIHESWTVSLSTQVTSLESVILPSHPRILAVIPDPDPAAPTDAAAHVNDLRSLLQGESYDLGTPEKFAEVRNWNDLEQVVSTQSFDIVYYFGQGDGTRLSFENSTGGSDIRLASAFADLLRNMKPRPKLAYMNCIGADAGGLLGIGHQMAAIVPSVVSNRTVLRSMIARRQACSFFRMVLLDSIAPHDAASSIYREIPNDFAGDVLPEWLTQVHNANYSEWHHDSPRDSSRQRVDPRWRWNVDRINQ